MRTKSGRVKRCKFIEYEACEEDEDGREVRGGRNEEDGDDAPNAEDLAFINDEAESCSSEDKRKVRISRREKELTDDDLELIQTNAGILPPRVVRTGGKRKFRRLERGASTKVYKDSDEDDVHTSDEDFIESDSDSSESSDASASASPASDAGRKPVLRAIPLAALEPRVNEAIAKADAFFGSDKFWREEAERPADEPSDEEAMPPPPPPARAPAPPAAARGTAVIFQKGFKSSVLAPAKPPKPPAKKPPAKRAAPKRPEWDADQPGYVYNRQTGQLMYRDAAGNTRNATGVDDF